MGSARQLVRHPSLADQVIADMRSRIIDGQLPPGTPLPSEREMCTNYGVSRTVIREAVKVLAAKGLVKSVPGSGLVVGTTDIDDVSEVLQLFMRNGTSLRYEELHEVRLALEVAAVRQCARRADEDTKDKLAFLADELATLKDDIPGASSNDFQFHRTIGEGTQNEFFVMIFDVLGGALMETRVATFSMDSKRFETVVEAHRKIADAISSGDPDLAAAAMTEHLGEVKTTWDAHPELVAGKNL